MEVQKLIKKDFLEFTVTDVAKKYNMYTPLGDKVLIRLYFFDSSKYTKQKETKIYKSMTGDATVTDDIHSKLFPIGKILAIGTGVHADIKKNLVIGDLICVPDWITSKQENPKHKEWLMMTKEKPSLANEIGEPPEFLNKIVQWKDDVFVGDKFYEDLTVHDVHTFLIPTRNITCKYES